MDVVIRTYKLRGSDGFIVRAITETGQIVVEQIETMRSHRDDVARTLVRAKVMQWILDYRPTLRIVCDGNLAEAS